MNEEYGIILSENSQIDLNSPFAPGTYVELKLKDENDENLNWGFVECDSWEKKEMLLKYDDYINNENFEKLIIINEPANSKYNVKYENNTLAFSLPITRSNEPTEDIKNYQYYIVVFAYSSKKALPNENDPKIVIDMSFRVGVGKDESVREGINDFSQFLKTQNLNEINHIQSVSEAVGFLRNIYEDYKNQKQNNNINNEYEYFRTYPQLAGKIAYIYYRFDLADEEFVRSVEGGKEYLEERRKFYEIAKYIYLNDYFIKVTYKEALENDFNHGKNAISTITEFLLKNLGRKLNMKEEDIPKIDTKPQDNDSGAYNKNNHTLSLRLDASFIDLVDTIIHEFRHCYIYRTKSSSSNPIEQLIYKNVDFFYIKWQYYTIFNAYDKMCLSFDSVEYGTGKCFFNKTYYESRKQTEKYNENKEKKEKDITASPLYFVQPCERDSRVVAGNFRKEIGLNE